MENQGKKKSQLKDAETFAIIGLVVIAIIVILVTLSSCNNTSAQRTPEEEKVYININGENIELVADEYGGQYLKQYISHGSIIYIPYPGATDDGSDTLHFYNEKNK